MKKLLFFVVAIYLCHMLYGTYQDYQEGIKQEDYMKLEQVKNECEYLINSNVLKRIAPGTTIICAELSAMHNVQDVVWSQIQEDLGEDFTTTLSNSDKIYISLYEKQRYYEIFVGDKSYQYRIYPDWNYPDLPEPEGFCK